MTDKDLRKYEECIKQAKNCLSCAVQYMKKTLRMLDCIDEIHNDTGEEDLPKSFSTSLNDSLNSLEDLIREVRKMSSKAS